MSYLAVEIFPCFALLSSSGCCFWPYCISSFDPRCITYSGCLAMASHPYAGSRPGGAPLGGRGRGHVVEDACGPCLGGRTTTQGAEVPERRPVLGAMVARPGRLAPCAGCGWAGGGAWCGRAPQAACPCRSASSQSPGPLYRWEYWSSLSIRRLCNTMGYGKVYRVSPCEGEGIARAYAASPLWRSRAAVLGSRPRNSRKISIGGRLPPSARMELR